MLPTLPRAWMSQGSPLVTAEGRWAATWAGNLDGRAPREGPVLCHSLLLEAARRLPQSQLAKQLL